MSINKTISLIEVNKLNEKIKNESALYFYRSTPFTEHGEYNYNGLLKENFFFEKLFSEKGKCTDYLDDIYNSIFKRVKKSVMLIGNPGCGKTTFVNYLKRKLINKHPNTFFKIFDFDKNTSNPTLDEYIEILSSYLLDLLCNDINNNNNNVNKVFYNLFRSNEKLILEKINAENNIKNFFIDFNIRFIQCSTKASTRYDFINNINRLFFNQILSLIVLWHISEIKLKDSVHKIVFCFDNLDVLVNSEIINGFFDNYFLFVRNIDSILQNLNDPYIRKNQFAYSDIFTFIFSCRQHTWAKFQQSCIHGNNIIKLSSLVLDITDAFNNNAILNKREEYIIGNRNIFNGFLDNASDTKSLLEDMHDWHNIYDLFDDDYRQCSITFEELLNENEQLLSEYKYVKNRLPANSLYGARGIVFKALFEKFKNEDLFKAIGVLDIDSTDSPLSTARIILNYLNNYTFQEKVILLKIVFRLKNL